MRLDYFRFLVTILTTHSACRAARCASPLRPPSCMLSLTQTQHTGIEQQTGQVAEIIVICTLQGERMLPVSLRPGQSLHIAERKSIDVSFLLAVYFLEKHASLRPRGSTDSMLGMSKR